MQIIVDLQRIKKSIDMCPSPTMIATVSLQRELFDNVQNVSRNIQTMPGGDEQLRTLTIEQTELAQEIKDTIDRYIEQYKQRTQEEPKGKAERETSKEEREENKRMPRKSWELSPEEKNEIQISTQKVAKDYNKSQGNPQPQMEENIVESSTGAR